MNKKPSPNFRNIENDPRLLFWFAMILMLAMFFWSLFLKPELLHPLPLALFIGLFAAHIFLHWQVSWVEKNRRWLAGYTLLQGILAFGISLLSANIGMVFCLFMALIGELLSIYRITVWGILTSAYLLILAFTDFFLLVGFKQAGWFALGTIPMIIFVAIYVILFTRQAQARAEAQALLKDLEAANRRLTEYAARVEDLTIANERQRMARELHDTLSQGLAGLILQLEAVDAHLSGNRPERARTIVQQTMEKARGTLTDARSVIDDLRQSNLVDLERAARQEVDHFSASTGIPCNLEVDDLPELPKEISEAGRRAIAEALTNIIRHAQAQNAGLRICLLDGEKELGIEISDDGIGFDPQTVGAGHYGLLGIEERVRLAGGRVEVRTGSGEGTCIKIRFPLENVSDE
jgi:two-component system, NarL family, sensor histidine kinase YdfH